MKIEVKTLKTLNALVDPAKNQTAERYNSIGKRIQVELVKNRYLYLMALPVIIYYLIFYYGPMYGAIIAFKKFDIAKGIWGSPWVGFEYFSQFLNSMYFWRLIKNTLLLNYYLLIFEFPAPIILALLLNELRNKRFKSLVQTITYLPHFISTIVICGMIMDFCSRDGIITNILMLFGLPKTNLMLVPEYFRSIYVSSSMWQQVGWGSIIYLSALSGIDEQLYEAATIDGAGRFRKIWNITLPGLRSIIVILLIMRIGQALNVGFEKIILLYNANTYEVADVISTFVYRKGLEGFEFSYTTAVGLFNSVVNFILLVAANNICKKLTDSGLW